MDLYMNALMFHNIVDYDFNDERVSHLKYLVTNFTEYMDKSSIQKIKYVKKIYNYIYENNEYFFNTKNDQFYKYKTKTGGSMVDAIGKTATMIRAEIICLIVAQKFNTDEELLEMAECYCILGKVETMYNRFIPILIENNNMSLNFKGSFTFKNDNIRETAVTDGVWLRLERVGFAVARLYFVDDGAVQVDIPQGIVVRDNTNNTELPTIFPGANFYVLAWSDNYTITYQGQIVVDLSTQRQWDLCAPADKEVATIEENKLI